MTTLSAPPLSTYDVYEIAYLAGGLPRVVDAAVVALCESGRLRFGSGGQLSPVSGLRPTSPVESAVLEAVGARGRSLVTLRWRAAEDPRLGALADRLERDGLITSGRRVLRRADPRPLLTATGRRALRQLRTDSSAHPRAGTALAVALGGSGGIPEELRQSVFGPPSAPPRTGRLFRGRVTDEAAAYPAYYLLPVWGGAGGGYDNGGGGWGGGDCGGGGDGGGC